MRISVRRSSFPYRRAMALTLGGIVIGLVGTLVCGGTRCDAARTPAAGWAAVTDTRAPQTNPAVSALFTMRCARCHDEDGTGTGLRRTMPRLPDFTSARWHRSRSDAQLVISILEGRGTRMPAFAGRMNVDQARALVAYLRRFAPAEPVRVADDSADEFDQRFRALQEEFELLRKQFYDLRRRKP